MTIYKVEIDESARNDLSNLLTFLKTVMSREGALRYIDVMVEEVQSLSLFAGLYQPSRSMVIRKIHPAARRMLSHNRKWNYVFHIEDDTVVITRQLGLVVRHKSDNLNQRITSSFAIFLAVSLLPPC